MVKTFNVDRTKGGTFSFKLDAQGNYGLHKDGFDKVKTLNLPELKAEATKTITTQDTKKISDQTQKAFGDVQPFYYKGGGADKQYTTEYQMTKDKSLDTSQPMVTDDNFAQARQKMTTDAAYRGVTPSDRQPGFEVANKGTSTSAVDRARVTAGDFISKVNDPKSMEYGMQLSSDMMGASTNKVDQQQKEIDRFGTGQWGPKSSKGMPQQSPYQDAIMRGQLGVKYEKPGIPQKVEAFKTKATEVKTTALKKVNTALKPLAKAVGFVMNPVGSVVGAVVGSLKEDATQKHAKGYFNVRDDGRIAGNPATDLYAGMNRVSAFGNLEKSGAKRIATREKTAAKYAGKWSKERMDKFNNTTKEMEKQQNKYVRDKHKAVAKDAVKKGANPNNPAEMHAASKKASNEKGNSGNGGGNTRVICTELHRTGEMSTVDWIRDTRFTFKTLTQKHVKGYLFWAVPTVKLMKKYPLYRKIWKHLAQHRANDIAWRLDEGKFDLLGRIYAGIGEPLCWLIGNCVSDKYIKEFNIKNWRRV